MEKSNKKTASLSDVKVVNVRVRKKGFPLGIFLLLFFMLGLPVSGGVIGHFVYSGSRSIEVIESYTRDYSRSLVEALAGAAELGYRKGSRKAVKELFTDGTRKNTFDEAFFVLKNGTLAAHSNSDVEKELHGNIANDEFAYNTDLILKPLLTKSRNTQFTDYNIVSKRIPFNRMERSLLKQYLYSGIDTSGWLVTRAVFSGKEPVGTVNLIIGKDRIFQSVMELRNESIYMLEAALGIVFFISLAVSLVVFIRYRSIQKDAIAISDYNAGAEATSGRRVRFEKPDAETEGAVSSESFAAHPGHPSSLSSHGGEAIPVELLDDAGNGRTAGEIRIIEIAAARKAPPRSSGETPTALRKVFDEEREIRDAIPIEKRRSS